MHTRRFFTIEQEAIIISAIRVAECKTSGEIRVHINEHFEENVVKQAELIFQKLGMHQTQERNGTLIYIAVENREFAIIGDLGIHNKVGASFWEAVRNGVQEKFKQGDFTGGVVLGIQNLSEEMGKYFPVNENKSNELSDEISYEKK
jgi:uncharacterized membrane protein